MSKLRIRSPGRTDLQSGGRETDLKDEVDHCLELAAVDGQHIHLKPTSEVVPLDPQNGCQVIPEAVKAAYALSRKLAAG